MAKLTEHTPGPWRTGYRSLHVVTDNAKIGGDAIIFDVRGWGYLTGNGHGALGLDPKEAVQIQKANARLAAAAPDMLEALLAHEAALKHLESYELDMDPDRFEAIADELHAEAERLSAAAIAKATGAALQERD